MTRIGQMTGVLALLTALLLPAACDEGGDGVPRPRDGGGRRHDGGGDARGDAGGDAGALAGIRLGLTHVRADGNRLVAGKGRLPGASPIDIQLGGKPAWLVAAASGPDETVWAVALTSGAVRAFRLRGRTATPITPALDAVPPGAPPLLAVRAGIPWIVAWPRGASRLTHPALLPGGTQRAYIDAAGALRVERPGTAALLLLAAPPDARILVDPRGRLLLYAERTGRYAHGVLGDALEAASFALVDTTPAVQIARRRTAPRPAVFEGIAPIWADLDGDGKREIVVTQSDATGGARVVAYDEAGALVAQGPAAGAGSRWRHVIAVADFGQGVEIAEVLTPHLATRAVQFLRRKGAALVVTASLAGGPTSHLLGSRNLDMGLAGDLDGDGALELLLVDPRLDALVAVRRRGSGAGVAWRLKLGGTLATNVAAAGPPSGGLTLGAARGDGRLRLWPAAR